MAPSPAAGKTGQTPKTPTKLGRKPQAPSASELGQQAGQATQDTPAPSGVKKPVTPKAGGPKAGGPKAGGPKAGGPKKLGTGTPKPPARPEPSDVASQAQGAPSEASRVEMKDSSEAPSEAGDLGSKAGSALQEQEPKPLSEASEAGGGLQSTAQGATKQAEDVADDATEKAGDTADDVDASTGESADDAQEQAGGPASTAGSAAQHPQQAAQDGVGQAQSAAGSLGKGAQSAAGDVASKAGAGSTVSGAQKRTQSLAGGPKSGAGSAVDGLKSTVDGAADQQLPEVPELSMLKGLDVGPDGGVKDKLGNTIGKLAEGDAEDLAGYAIGDNGEIVDDDGDLVGRVELIPEAAQSSLDQLKSGAEPVGLPDLSILKGLEVGEDGNILDHNGNAIAKVAEGDAEELVGHTVDEHGEILDEEGDLVGRVELTEAGQELASKAKDTAGGLTDGLPEVAPPDLNILQGLKVGEDGMIFDEQGNPVAKVAEGDAEELVGQTVGENGEILDEDGDLIGTVQFTPEKLKELTEKAQKLAGVDLSFLKGLEINEDGSVLDAEGNVVGRVAEGDAEALAGYTVGDNGEVVDDDGDLVGRVEPTDEKLRELTGEVADGLPDIAILQGLTTDATGQILNDEGDTIGQLIEGNPSELQGKTFNEQGEILDDEGNVIGKARIHPDAVDLLKEKDGELADEIGEALPELPGLEALEGRQLNEAGEIVDDEGNVLATLAEGDPDKVKGLSLNEKGEVVDEDGNVIGRVDLAEGAAERLAGAVSAAGQIDPLKILEGRKVNRKGKVLNDDGDELAQLVEGDPKECAGKLVNEKGEVLDADGNVIGRMEIVPGEAADEALEELKQKLIEAGELPDVNDEATLVDQLPTQILEGLKVNKKGQVLNEDGDPIGELVEGDPAACAGKKVNEHGEVLDKDGNVIGQVKVIPGEATDEAVADLRERLGGVIPGVDDVEAVPDLPPLDILEGLKVNKKGQILDEDGEPVGELVEGDISQCAGKKVNANGEVLDADGNVIGIVKTLPKKGEEGEEEDELPPLSILEGMTVNKQGKIVNDDGIVIGELIEGDAKKLSKMGITCDDQGIFWDNRGNILGRAKTLPVEKPEEEPPFAGFDGAVVNKQGYVEDENGTIIGQVVEGDIKKLVGRPVDEDGDILDKKGNAIGRAERLPEEEEPEPDDLSVLQGKTVNKMGIIIGDEGVPIGRLVAGNLKDCQGKLVDDEGQIWNDRGEIIGRCELIPPEEREEKPEGPFAGLEGVKVIKDGKVADVEGNVIGEVVDGDPKRLVGLAVDEDGDILDKYGNVKGRAERFPEEEEPDTSILDGLTLNKQGYLCNDEGIPVGRLVEGDPKELAGRKSDENGFLYSDTGKVIGRCEIIPEDERVKKLEGPFAGLEGLHVVPDGWVEDEDGNRVGQLVEGDPKRLIGQLVDEDGDIIDKYGNVKGHAVPWEEPEEEPEDLTPLAGTTVNKAGNLVDGNGTIIGRVAEGDPQNMIGYKCDGKGQIWDNAGNVVGRAELVRDIETKPEGPFSGFENPTVVKDGTVQLPDGTIVGRVIEGDIQKLIAHVVDEDGDISDKNGNVIGKAERWEPEEKPRSINPMCGRKVNRDGEVRDEDGNVIGKLTAGDLGRCIGLEIDDNGYVIDNDGNRVGECTLLENLQDEGPTEEELEEMRKRQEDAEIAEKMTNICNDCLERIQPVCHQITEYIDAADRTPREELDEEELVNNVKPLIEEGGRILQECNGALRGLDPDGRIAAQAKGRAETQEATPEEYRLADVLKEITGTVVQTIDNAKRKIADMPHAKKKLNPLWALLTEPLFQIIAAVGLLLSGVLGLVGKLLNGLGLGGLVNGLLGGLGIDSILGGLGFGSISEAFGFGKKEKKSGGGNKGLPLVGGLLGKKGS